MKVLLAFPPAWHPIMPHMALPSLTAYLRARGVEVVQRDLNIEIFDAMLSRRYLAPILRRLERDSRTGRSARNAPKAQVELESWALSAGPALVARVDQAKELIRSPRFYEPAAGMEAFVIIQDALRFASLPHFPSTLHLTGYDSAHPPDDSKAILAAVQDREHNVFYQIMQTTIVPQIVRENPDLVGISVTSNRQVIASMTLAHLLKEAGVKAHITLGGKMMTCWRDSLAQAPALFDLFDSAVVFAGEEPLLRLVEAIEKGEDIASVPNLLYRRDGEVKSTPVGPAEPVNELPMPDYEGFPIGKYLAPEAVLPISGSRGCYWHRCAFCNVGHGESAQFEQKQAARVLEEMKSLSQTYHTPYFFFSDEAVSPRILRELAKLIMDEGLEFEWTGAARFERSYDLETLQHMRDAGCRMLMYGLESGSQRTLERMHKGTDLDVVRQVLRDGTEAGIWNHLFVFFGFPGETLQEAQETINFIYSEREHINSLCTGTFMLEPFSAVAANPAEYGVANLHERRGSDLGYYYEYEAVEGLDAEQAERVEAIFVNSLPDKRRPHLYFHDIYRFLYACQFGRHEPLPLFLQVEAAV